MIKTNTKQHTQIANMNWQEVYAYVTLQTSDGKVYHRRSVWIEFQLTKNMDRSLKDKNTTGTLLVASTATLPTSNLNSNYSQIPTVNLWLLVRLPASLFTGLIT